VSSKAPCAVRADGSRLAGSRLWGAGGIGPGPDCAAAGGPVVCAGSGLAGNAGGGAAGTGRGAIPNQGGAGPDAGGAGPDAGGAGPDAGGAVHPGCCAWPVLMSGDCAGAPWDGAPDSNQDRGRVAGSGRGPAPEAGRAPGRGSLPGPGAYRGAGLVAPLRPAWPGVSAPGGTRRLAGLFPDG